MVRLHKWGLVGVDVRDCENVGDILDKADLNWQVKKYPIVKPNGEEWKGVQQLLRTDNYEQMTVCSEGWEPIQNDKLIKQALQIAEGIEGKVAQVGYRAKTGRAKELTKMVWCLIEPGKRFAEKYADLDIDTRFDPYIVATNAHNYGMGINLNYFFVREVCSNGMVAEINISKRYNHIGVGSGIDSNAVENLEAAIARQIEQERLLLDTFMSEEQAYIWLVKQYGHVNKEFQEQPTKVKLLWQIYRGELDYDFSEYGIDLGQRSPQVMNSAYGILQAVSAYENHFGSGDLNNKLVSLLREEARNRLFAVQRQLNELAQKHRQRQQQIVSVGVNWR